MKLRIFNEGDSCACANTCAGGFLGVNTSAGSNIVNYGPNNPYLSNLAEYQRRKKNSKDDVYKEDYNVNKKNSKNAGHKLSKKRKNDRFHEPDNW